MTSREQRGTDKWKIVQMSEWNIKLKKVIRHILHYFRLLLWPLSIFMSLTNNEMKKYENRLKMEGRYAKEENENLLGVFCSHEIQDSTFCAPDCKNPKLLALNVKTWKKWIEFIWESGCVSLGVPQIGRAAVLIFRTADLQLWPH